MPRLLNLTIESCKQCPYSFEGTTKGLGNSLFRCHKVYDDRPNFQGNYRTLGDRYEYGSIPNWCPLPENVDSADRGDSAGAAIGVAIVQHSTHSGEKNVRI